MMKPLVRAGLIVVEVLAIIGLVGAAQAAGAESACPNPVGFAPSEEILREMLDRHHRAVRGAGDAITLCNLSRSGLDLSGVDLAGLDLRAANLPRVDFSGSNLQHAYLHAANLEQGRFRGARLTDAVLRKSKLSGADFEAASMQGVILRKSDLRGASFYRADVKGGDFSKADLSGASFLEAQMGAAELRRAILVRADLRGADLTDANLRQADLTHANLAGAILSGADLTGAVLDGANLFETDVGPQNGVTEEELQRIQRIPGEDFAAQLGLESTPLVTSTEQTLESSLPSNEVPESIEGAPPDAAEETNEPQPLALSSSPEPAAASAPPSGGFRVQLGAFRVETTAARVWEELLAAFPERFHGLSPVVEPSSPDGGQVIWHRLQTGAFASMKAAQDFCLALQSVSSDLPCLAVHAATP